MEKIIKKIEDAKDKSIIPFIGLILDAILLGDSRNNHDINMGATPIDPYYYGNLRKVAIDKLIYFGIKEEKIQSWLDAFLVRVNEFGIFKDQICSEIVEGTIPMESLSKLFSKNQDVFESEFDRIMDKQSDADCALARKLGYNYAIPMSCKTKYYLPSDAKCLHLA